MKGTGNDDGLLPIVLFLTNTACLFPQQTRSRPRVSLLAHDRIARPVEAHSRPTRPQLHAAPNSFSHRRVRITPPRCIYDRGPTRTLRLAATVPPPYSCPLTIATARWSSKPGTVFSSRRRHLQEKRPLRSVPRRPSWPSPWSGNMLGFAGFAENLTRCPLCAHCAYVGHRAHRPISAACVAVCTRSLIDSLEEWRSMSHTGTSVGYARMAERRSRLLA